MAVSECSILVCALAVDGEELAGVSTENGD
jgi:hypothetical protein